MKPFCFIFSLLVFLAPMLGHAEQRPVWTHRNLFDLYQLEMNQISTRIGVVASSSFQARKKARDHVAALNRRTLAEMENYRVEANPLSTRADFITREQAKEVLVMINLNPVVGYYKHREYDPDFRMGFCFGRATFVHIELLRRGVSKKAIGKLFVLGSMKTGTTSWRYHVTTIVKGPGKTWWAIDSVVGRVVTVEEWMQELNTFDIEPREPLVRYYFADGKKFAPSSTRYSAPDLQHPDYNNYFNDLMKWFRENPVRDDQSFKRDPQVPSPADEIWAYLNTDSVNFRDAPRADSRVLGVLVKGQRMTVLETEGNWLKVSVDGVVGYVYGKYITLL